MLASHTNAYQKYVCVLRQNGCMFSASDEVQLNKVHVSLKPGSDFDSFLGDGNTRTSSEGRQKSACNRRV